MVKKLLLLGLVVLLILGSCDLGEDVDSNIIETSSSDKDVDSKKEAGTTGSDLGDGAGDVCGDAVCGTTENKCSCPSDCGKCSGKYNETFEFACVNNHCTYQEIKADCGDGICLPSEQGHCPFDCPTCADTDVCTRDYFDPVSKTCKHDKFSPCCGNGVCEIGEQSSCIDDCESAYDLSDYPQPFIIDNQLNAYIIVGNDAGPKGVIAAINVIRGLDFSGVKSGYSSESVLDTEVDSISGKNVILIGNPCHNKFVLELYGLTKDRCGEGLQSGDRVVRLFKTSGSTYALVVSGYNEDDVRSASVLVENWESTQMSGTEFIS